MYFIATIFILITAVVLILTVLVQNSKGGGLAASFGGGGNQFGGVAQTNKFLEKATWGLAIALLFFSLVASISITSKQQEAEQSNIYENIQEYNFNTQPTIPAEINVPEQ